LTRLPVDVRLSGLIFPRVLIFPKVNDGDAGKRCAAYILMYLIRRK